MHSSKANCYPKQLWAIKFLSLLVYEGRNDVCCICRWYVLCMLKWTSTWSRNCKPTHMYGEKLPIILNQVEVGNVLSIMIKRWDQVNFLWLDLDWSRKLYDSRERTKWIFFDSTRANWESSQSNMNEWFNGIHTPTTKRGQSEFSLTQPGLIEKVLKATWMSDSMEYEGIHTPTTGSSKKTGNMHQLLECCCIRQQIHKLMLHM